MKKRSMLAIASLATGFVVAAVTPSHAADKGSLNGLNGLNALNVPDTLSSAGHPITLDSLSIDDQPHGQR
ncbi:hypothetical protein [Streptomyces sp. NPDC054783]